MAVSRPGKKIPYRNPPQSGSQIFLFLYKQAQNHPECFRLSQLISSFLHFPHFFQKTADILTDVTVKYRAARNDDIRARIHDTLDIFQIDAAIHFDIRL